MSKGNIVVQITGSIAAFKAGTLISTLVKNGYSVQCVPTESALKFIGEATLEGLSGRAIKTSTFKSGEMMDHINLAKWADLFITYPASANTINRLNAGLSDDLIGATYLANNFNKPYLIAPGMNVEMLKHPVTQKSIKSMEGIGCYFFDTEEGLLACGDVGKGRVIDPGTVFLKIEEILCKS
jgi:phosphopantothenoylcysteine synthetase/decarboxylase